MPVSLALGGKMIYKCGHCNFIGHCYGIPTSAKCGVSAPFCSRCGKNDKLKKVNPPRFTQVSSDVIWKNYE